MAVDVDEAKVAAVEAGVSYIEDVASERLRASLARDRAIDTFRAPCACGRGLDLRAAALTPNREPDLSPLIASGRALGQVVQQGQLVVLESTTFPGTDPRALGAPARASRVESRRWIQRGLLAGAG